MQVHTGVKLTLGTLSKQAGYVDLWFFNKSDLTQKDPSKEAVSGKATWNSPTKPKTTREWFYPENSKNVESTQGYSNAAHEFCQYIEIDAL